MKNRCRELVPLSVDGTLVASTLAIVSQRRHRRPAGWVPWFGLTLGILASLAANVAAARPELIAQLIAAWPPVALAVSVETLVVVLRADLNMRRPDQRIPEEALAGSTAPRWREGLASDTQGNGSETPTGPDMARPDQRVEVAEPLTGSITSARIATLDVTSTNATPAATDVTVRTSDSPNRGDQPGRPRGIDEPAELATPGVWGSALDDMHPGNRLDGLIASGAGRRKIAAELGVSEHHARKLITASRNGVIDV